MDTLLETSIYSSAGELLNFIKALQIATNSDFMSREHAGQIWKKIVKNSGLDIVKKIKQKRR